MLHHSHCHPPPPRNHTSSLLLWHHLTMLTWKVNVFPLLFSTLVFGTIPSNRIHSSGRMLQVMICLRYFISLFSILFSFFSLSISFLYLFLFLLSLSFSLSCPILSLSLSFLLYPFLSYLFIYSISNVVYAYNREKR